MTQKATIGRIVHYKTESNIIYPAIITMTTDTWVNAPHPDKPPTLDSDNHVHLLVNTAYGIEAHYNVEQGIEPRQWRWPVIA